MSVALSFKDLVKRYGKQTVLDGISLDINRGEFFGLVGVNGAGKTTLIKSLLDLSEIQAGSIEIFGEPHTRTSSREHLAYLPERFTPPYFAKAREFLDYLARLHGGSYDADEVEQCLRVLDLETAALEKPVRALSKGMGQKLGLASVLLSGKQLLVLDEPMTGLDPKSHARLKVHLDAIRAGTQTVFFCSHNLADVASLCDRVAVLHQGTLRFCGAPQEMCDAYGSNDIDAAYLSCVEG